MIEAVVAHLKAECPAIRLFGRIADLAALDQASGGPKATPAAFVFIAEEAAAENERATAGILQRNEVDLAVLLIVRNVADAAGGAAASDIDALKETVRLALLGWQPGETCEPIEAVSFRVVGIRNGFVRYELIFSTAHYLEAS